MEQKNEYPIAILLPYILKNKDLNKMLIFFKYQAPYWFSGFWH